MTMPLQLHNVAHAYLGRKAIQNIELTVPKGEIVAIVGPSGCGKSTLAHLASGLVDTSFGTITRTYAAHAMVFQEPRLMPWATTLQNIEFPLKLQHVPRTQRKELIEFAAAQVSLLPSDLEKYPSELSGGMRQRTAIARALIVQPDFIYFDEPFTALDVALKRRMQDLVIDAHHQNEISGIFITHDLFEAARIAHKVAVMNANGDGIRGVRSIPGPLGTRDDATIFDLVKSWRDHDHLFAHIHDIDERKIV